jgi:hypothetical protein
MVAGPGVIVIDSRTGGPTVRVADPLTEPAVAVIVAAPCTSDVARPVESTVATLGVAEVQFAELVISDVEPFVRVAVAVNCSVNPAATVAVAGVTAMETTWAGVTVMVADPLMEPLVAVITAVPTDCPVTLPDALTVATAVFWEDHVAEFVRSVVVPSVKIAVA